MNKTACVADDVELVREGNKILLESHGYEVQAFTNGRELLEYLRLNPKVDLVVVDFNMDGMNGLEVFDEMQKDEALMDITAVICTGMTHLKERIEEAGALFADKGCMPDLETVLTALERCCHKH